MSSVPTGLPPTPSVHPTIVELRFSLIEARLREELLFALPSVGDILNLSSGGSHAV